MKEFKFRDVEDYEQDHNAVAVYDYVEGQVSLIAEEGQVSIVDESFDHEFGTHECESVEACFDSIEFYLTIYDDMEYFDNDFSWIVDLVRDMHIEINGFRVIADVDSVVNENTVTVTVNFDVE